MIKLYCKKIDHPQVHLHGVHLHNLTVKCLQSTQANSTNPITRVPTERHMKLFTLLTLLQQKYFYSFRHETTSNFFTIYKRRRETVLQETNISKIYNVITEIYNTRFCKVDRTEVPSNRPASIGVQWETVFYIISWLHFSF